MPRPRPTSPASSTKEFAGVVYRPDGLKHASWQRAAAFLGLTQFCLNFNGVYLAERYITSGVVATEGVSRMKS